MAEYTIRHKKTIVSGVVDLSPGDSRVYEARWLWLEARRRARRMKKINGGRRYVVTRLANGWDLWRPGEEVQLIRRPR